MNISGTSYRRVESTPNQNPTLGVASQQQQEQRGQQQGAAGSVADSVSLSPEAQQQVRQLQQRDREVRSHEQAHISAGGPPVQETGRAHVCTPVTFRNLVCRLLLEHKKEAITCSALCCLHASAII